MWNGGYASGELGWRNVLDRIIWMQGIVADLLGAQGFGVTARSTTEAKRLEPTAIVTFRQADVGEYLREVRQAINWAVSCR